MPLVCGAILFIKYKIDFVCFLIILYYTVNGDMFIFLLLCWRTEIVFSSQHP